jgi:hypothetical protein
MLYNIPTLILVSLLLLAMMATVEIGIRVGIRFGQKTWSNAHEIHTALTGATLALMGLMLAFTFNMSAGRYDVRTNLVVSEAGAIESAQHALSFLAPAPRAEAEALLRYYTAKRVAYLAIGHDADRERHVIAQSHALYGELWRIATAAESYAATEPQLRAVQYAELTRALLEVSDEAAKREAARDRRVPEPVLFMLFALAIGASGILAYISGASGHPDRLPTYGVLILICLVIFLTIDFDRPRRGLVRVDAAPLQRLLSEVPAPQ